MQDSEDTDRRTFLNYAGAAATGVTLSTAGCVGGDDDGDNQTDEDNTTENGDDNGDAQGLQSITVTQGAFPDNLDPVKDNSTPTYKSSIRPTSRFSTVTRKPASRSPAY
jgi:hypothetical protein